MNNLISFYVCKSNYTSSHNWADSLVMADGHFDIPQEFEFVGIPVGQHTIITREEARRNENEQKNNLTIIKIMLV